MRKIIYLTTAAIGLTACAGNSPTHYNHLRINTPDPLQNRIEYRDLTRAYPVELPQPISSQPDVAATTQPTASLAPTDQPSISASAGSVALAGLADAQQSTGADAPQCKNTGFTFQPGMLRENLKRVLADCDLELGQWAIGDADYLIDYPIRGRFNVQMPNGISDILDVVKNQYGVIGTIDAATQTVNFFAATQPYSGEIEE